MNCPCGNDVDLSLCCGPFLSGTMIPKTAEQLMRSRYTAYTQANINYIKKTTAPESLKDFDEASSLSWAQTAQWQGLKILSTKEGQSNDSIGVVEFVATYGQDKQVVDHHEVSQFRKNQAGEWLFVDGELITAKPDTYRREKEKVGRNDPCPCGSGKKFKKCCAI